MVVLAYPPTARFPGTNPDRQSVGKPGHCENCAEHGHVKAHPNLGCGDVGCYSAHGPDEEAAATKAAAPTVFTVQATVEDQIEARTESEARQILRDRLASTGFNAR